MIDEGINSSQAGRLIRNLLEIATYRSMTLLGSSDCSPVDAAGAPVRAASG